MACRTIAIGDIHGCSAALVDVIDPGPEDTLVPLGDYIDRGVLDQLLALRERCLLGNHEELLAQVRGHGRPGFLWTPHLPYRPAGIDPQRWAGLPPIPARHYSSKVAVVGHTPQKSGEILDLGFLKCIDTFCHGGGWLTALEVHTGQVWQANAVGQVRPA